MQLSSVKLAGNPKPTGSHVIFLIFLCPSVFNLSRYCRQTAGRGVPWGFKSRIESSWLSARGATPRPEMNPARLCIRGYVVDYWPIFLLGKLLRHSGNGGRASKLRLGKRLSRKCLEADISIELNTSLAHRADLFSDPGGFDPLCEMFFPEICFCCTSTSWRILCPASVLQHFIWWF